MKIFYRVRPVNQEQIINYDAPLAYWGEIFRFKMCQVMESNDSADWSTWSLDDIDKMNHTSLLCAARSCPELADDVQIYDTHYKFWSERRSMLLAETDALSALVVEE